LAKTDRVVAVRLLETDHHQTSIQTSEKRIRVNDEAFDALLIVESLDHQSARSAAEHLKSLKLDCVDLAGDAANIYVNVFSLSRSLLDAVS